MWPIQIQAANRQNSQVEPVLKSTLDTFNLTCKMADWEIIENQHLELRGLGLNNIYNIIKGDNKTKGFGGEQKQFKKC